MGPGGDTRRAGLRGSSERHDGAPGHCAQLPHAPAHPPHARCSCPGRAPFLSRAVCACPWPGQRAARLWAAEACAPRCLTGVLLIPGAPWQRGRQSRVTLAEPAGSGLRPLPVPHVTAHGELGRAVPPPQPAAVGSAGPPLGELRVTTVQAAVCQRPTSPACPSQGHGVPPTVGLGVGAGWLQHRAADPTPPQVSVEDRARPPLSRCLTFKVPSPSVPGPHCVVTAVWTEQGGSLGREGGCGQSRLCGPGSRRQLGHMPAIPRSALMAPI